jgi:hypothetical protein
VGGTPRVVRRAPGDAGVRNARLLYQAPLVNVVEVLVVLLSVIPIYLASRLSSDAGNVGAGTR